MKLMQTNATRLTFYSTNRFRFQCICYICRMHVDWGYENLNLTIKKMCSCHELIECWMLLFLCVYLKKHGWYYGDCVNDKCFMETTLSEVLFMTWDEPIQMHNWLNVCMREWFAWNFFLLVHVISWSWHEHYNKLNIFLFIYMVRVFDYHRINLKF